MNEEITPYYNIESVTMCFQQALEIQKACYSDAHPLIAVTLKNMAMIENSTGKTFNFLFELKIKNTYFLLLYSNINIIIIIDIYRKFG